MKWLLSAALILSLGLNLWLIASRSAGPSPGTGVEASSPFTPPVPSGSPPADSTSGPGAGPRTTTADPAALRTRVAELETQLAAARQLADLAEALDPVDLIIHSNRPLAWKARELLEIEPEEARREAAWKLGRKLSEDEGSAQELLEVLSIETDPRVVGLLGEMIRAGATARARPEDHRAFAELLRNAALPEVRAACVRGVRAHGRGGEEARAIAEEMNAALTAAVYSETSPDVIGAIADVYDKWGSGDEMLTALKDAAGRLPAGDGRRSVWKAIARGTYRDDLGVWLTGQFEQATEQELRDDIAAGIARAGNSGGGSIRGTPEEKRARVLEARARFLTVYQGTADPDVRRRLVRGALHGLGCFARGTSVEDYNDDGGQFFREIAALEPDPTLQERLLKAAVYFEIKGFTSSTDFDDILAGKD